MQTVSATPVRPLLDCSPCQGPSLILVWTVWMHTSHGCSITPERAPVRTAQLSPAPSSLSHSVTNAFMVSKEVFFFFFQLSGLLKRLANKLVKYWLLFFFKSLLFMMGDTSAGHGSLTQSSKGHCLFVRSLSCLGSVGTVSTVLPSAELLCTVWEGSPYGGDNVPGPPLWAWAGSLVSLRI